MTLLTRFLSLQLLMLWQGGFLFYALVVVPVGSGVIGSTEQGFVTRLVTNWLNGLGVACLTLCFFDAYRTDSLASIRRFFTFLALLAQVSLFFLHRLLDEMLDPAQRIIVNPPRFYNLHAAYLIISGVLWALMLLNLLLTLIAWRDVDARIHQTITRV